MISQLAVLFFSPLIALLVLQLLSKMSAKMMKVGAFLLSLLPLCILITYSTEKWLNSTVQWLWLPSLSIHFSLAVDSVSLLFLYLVAVITPFSILSVKSERLHSPQFFYSLIFILQTLLIGFFTANDLALFTIFWEGMLIPLYFIISIWGGPLKEQAAIKFIIYMIAGSSMMLAAVFALFFQAGTFDLETLRQTASQSAYAPWILAVFLLAFAVKTPLFPFHAWLPDTYYQASTAGTILLAGLLSKAGIYGLYRIGLGLFPELLTLWSPFLLTLAITGVFYGAFAAWMENDYKRLLAYSSFSHVNFILIGLFFISLTAQTGAILQAINHGVTITALFMVAGWLEERISTTRIDRYSGLAKFLPYLCWLTLFFVLSSVALPGTNNFVGELLILLGLFQWNPWLSSLLTLSVIFSVVYMLRWMQKVYFEAPGFFQEAWIDIRAKEFLIAAPLIALVLWIGIYPAPILEQLNNTLTYQTRQK